MDAPVDVVIITAAEGEDTALLKVSEGALSPWVKVPSPEGYTSEVYRAAFESLTVQPVAPDPHPRCHTGATAPHHPPESHGIPRNGAARRNLAISGG